MLSQGWIIIIIMPLALFEVILLFWQYYVVLGFLKTEFMLHELEGYI